MKKKMIALLAGALMMISASSAFAYFEDYSLIRVVYNSTTGNEMATDLGNVNTLLTSTAAAGAAGYTVGGGANAFITGTNLGATQDAKLYVAYLAMDSGISGSSTNVWLSSTAATQGNNAAAYPALQNSALNTFFGNYATYGTQSVQTTNADMNSYQLNFNATPGKFADYLGTISGEANLATLATASATQNLFFWANGDVNGAGTKVLTLLTNADGSTTLQANQTAPVPIPAAAYLLGSGLLGMLGLRRKQRG